MQFAEPSNTLHATSLISHSTLKKHVNACNKTASLIMPIVARHEVVSTSQKINC